MHVKKKGTEDRSERAEEGRRGWKGQSREGRRKEGE